MPEQGVEPFPVDVEAWEPWSPAEAALLLEGLEAPWYVAAGWALDLFLGHETRPHKDLEVGIPGQRFAEVRERLAGYELVVVGDGHGWPPTESTLAAHHQTWVREPGGPWRLDVFREQWDGDVWICRRDPRIRLGRDALILRSREGIPYAAPEVVLLFKAKATRPQDDDDFATVLPHLDTAGRRWLRSSLELVHPGHRWLQELTY